MVTKKIKRKFTKGKGKIWKKGQSSSSNPEFNKHRLEAKKRAVFGIPGQGNLTEAKLNLHNKLITENNDDEAEELMSIGEETTLTAFTNCSLPAFNRLLRNWNAGSFLHKEMLAVVAAVTEVLKTQGGKETETEYFAALMTTLEVTDTTEGLTAVVCLLSLVVKRLNESILKLHCQTACEKFSKLLINYMNTDYSALLKNLLNIIYAFLKVKSHWSESSSNEFSIILEFSSHHKPKVRKTAQHIISTLLIHHIPEGLNVHPAASITANFCIQKLENSGGASKTTFYVLSLLQEIISVFPKASIKLACETMFKLMILNNSLIISSCLTTLKGLFVGKPKPENLTVDLNVKMLNALYEYQPNLNDEKSLILWLELMEYALINLYRLDAKVCLSHLPKFFSIAIKCWQSDYDQILSCIATILENLLTVCIDPNSNEFQQFLLDDPIRNPMHKMFHYVEEALSYQYHKAWKYVILVLAKFFEIMGKHSYTVMIKCLQSLANMRDSYQFSHIAELEKAIGIAILSMGPQIVLNAIPLLINGESDRPDFPRSWLLPLLRDYTKRTELEFFIKYFLPLAVKLRKKVRVLEQQQKMVESKLYDLICSQIWSLLPGFCTEPTDLKQSFKNIARTLGIILSNEPTLRMTVLTSLRLLINTNLENEENKNEIARFAKNYLPILFNLFTTETKGISEERVRLAVYETCKIYLQITDQELCINFFQKAMEKLANDIDTFSQAALIDLNKALLPYVSENLIAEFYDYFKPLLQHSNRTIQKKCYGCINVLCSNQSEVCHNFVKTNLKELCSILCGTVAGLTPSTRALRLNSLQHIIKSLNQDDKEYIVKIIPEVVLSTKENSTKARNAAYSLLVEIGHTFKRWNSDNSADAIKEYLTLLLAGLAGSPHLMSATILAIGRIVFEFKNDISSEVMHILIKNVCLLLTSSSREVIDSALSFIKILFSTLDFMDLAQHVEYMVTSITSIAEDNQRHFRFKAKEIFTRLIRKFGYEMIVKLVPDSYKKQLLNIRKLEARKRRKKEIAIETTSGIEHQEVKRKSETIDDLLEDSDDELASDKKSKKYTVSKENNYPFIEEGDEDIVDLMDPAVHKKIIATKPKVFEQKKALESFPISEDGRLIIQDEDEMDSKSTRSEKNKKILKSDLNAVSKKSNKRKLESDSEDETDNEPKIIKKGIYRTIEKPANKKKKFGEEFKAKKAGGDIKKGKFDPYAYVPLNRQALNKRKQVKFKGQFKNLVKAASKGAMIGMKKKSRQAKKKKNFKKK